MQDAISSLFSGLGGAGGGDPGAGGGDTGGGDVGGGGEVGGGGVGGGAVPAGGQDYGVEGAPSFSPSLPIETGDEPTTQSMQQAVGRSLQLVSELEQARTDYQLVRGSALEDAAIGSAAQRFSMAPGTMRRILEMPEGRWNNWKGSLTPR